MASPALPKDKFRPAAKVAEIYGMSARTVYDHVKRPDFPMDGFRTLPSGKIFVDPVAFDSWLIQFNVQLRTSARIRSGK